MLQRIAHAARRCSDRKHQREQIELHRFFMPSFYTEIILISFPLCSMKNTFTTAALCGVVSLCISVPALAQSAGYEQQTQERQPFSRSVPSQACIQAKVALEDAKLADFDAMMARRKQALQNRRAALAAAAILTDESARRQALQAITEQSSEKHDGQDVPQSIQTAHEAVRTACSNAFMENRGPGNAQGQGQGQRPQQGQGQWLSPGQGQGPGMQNGDFQRGRRGGRRGGNMQGGFNGNQNQPPMYQYGPNQQ